jgi:hypothetical protein
MLILYGGMGQDPLPDAPAVDAVVDTTREQLSLEEQMALIQTRMQGRMKEELMKQCAVQTAISLGLLCVPVVGWILSGVYSVLTLPGSLYVKARMADLVRETQERIRVRTEKVQDEIAAVQERIQNEVFDQAVELAISGQPLEGFSGLGNWFESATRAVKRVVSHVTHPVKIVRAVKQLPSKAVREIAALPRTIPKTLQTFPAKIAREVKALPSETFKAGKLLITKPDDALKPVGELIQAVTRPILKPLEKPMGKVWKPITQGITAVGSAFVWASGQILVRAYGGVMYAVGNKEEAARADDAAKKYNTFVRDRVWKRSAESLQTLENFKNDMRKLGTYVIGTAGLDEIKEKLAELEAKAYQLLALKRTEALEQLATPEARQAILLTLAKMLRETPGGLAAMDARARFLRAAIYNQNNLLHPDQIIPEPTFREAVAEGWRVVTRTDLPVQVYGEDMEAAAPAAVAGLASGDMLGGMDVMPLIRDRDSLIKQRANNAIAWEQGWDLARSLPEGPKRDYAVSKMEQRQPFYEREQQKMTAQITALDDQIKAGQRENAGEVGTFLTKFGGSAKKLAVAGVNTAVGTFNLLQADIQARGAERDVVAAAADLRAAQAEREIKAKASQKTLLIAGVAIAAALLLLKNRK